MSLWLTKCSKDPPEGIRVLGSAPSFKSRNTETQQTVQHQQPLLQWQKREITLHRGRQISHKCPQAVLGMSTFMFVTTLLQQHVVTPVTHTRLT